MDGVDRVGALAVAAMLVLGGVAVVGLESGGDPPSVAPDPAAELVDAWARTRRATYHATGTFERRGEGGAHLSVPVEIAQRPPDRLLRQFGEVTGRRGDRPLECPAPVGDAELECHLGPPDGSFDEVVAGEVDAFRWLVTGADPLYDVSRGDRDGCWRMTRRRPDPRSGFGVEAVVCVDQPTGALRSVTIDHGSVDERTVYDRISPEVTDESLEP